LIIFPTQNNQQLLKQLLKQLLNECDVKKNDFVVEVFESQCWKNLLFSTLYKICWWRWRESNPRLTKFPFGHLQV